MSDLLTRFAALDRKLGVSAAWWSEMTGVSERGICRWRRAVRTGEVSNTSARPHTTRHQLRPVLERLEKRDPSMMRKVCGPTCQIELQRIKRADKEHPGIRRHSETIWQARIYNHRNPETTHWPTLEHAALWWNGRNAILYPKSRLYTPIAEKPPILQCADCGRKSRLVIHCEILYSTFQPEVVDCKPLCLQCRRNAWRGGIIYRFSRKHYA